MSVAAVHYRLVDGLPELLRAADLILEATADRVRSCPRYGRTSERRAA